MDIGSITVPIGFEMSSTPRDLINRYKGLYKYKVTTGKDKPYVMYAKKINDDVKVLWEN